MNLWEFPEDIQRKIVAAHLAKYGDLIGEIRTPHSIIYTFGGHGNYVVAKGIRTEQGMPEDKRTKFLKRALYEASNTYMIYHHPLIHRFGDVALVHGVPFFISRKRKGTLLDLIAGALLSPVDVLCVSIQIAHALAFAKGKGIVCHQDLKPENIFIDFLHEQYRLDGDYPVKYRVAVSDFELANAFMILRHPYGSRPYMAPEQYQPPQENPRDFSKVDVFAMGVMLCEMSSGGVHPVGHRTSLIWPVPSTEMGRKWLREDPWKQWLKQSPKISEECQVALDARLHKLIEGCLETEPSARPTMQALEDSLFRILAQEDAAAAKAMKALLVHYDAASFETESGGWPHLDKCMDGLNAVCSDERP